MGKNGLVSIVCACTEYPTIRGISDLYVNSPCNFPLYFTHTLIYLQTSAVCNKLANCMSCACCVEQRLAFALQKVGKGRLMLKEQLYAIHSAYDQEDAFA